MNKGQLKKTLQLFEKPMLDISREDPYPIDALVIYMNNIFEENNIPYEYICEWEEGLMKDIIGIKLEKIIGGLNK